MTVAVTSDTIALFLIVVARVSGVVVSAPLIGDEQVPRLVKAGLVLILSLVIVQVPGVGRMGVPTAMIPFVLDVLAQLLVGIALGLIARTTFWAVTIAGHIVSLQAGLSMSAVYNPLTRQADPVLTQLYAVVAALTFLAVNGDVLLIAALSRSFDLAPPSALSFSPALLRDVMEATIAVTELGLQIALPVAASLVAATMVMGVVSRALPQLNVFILSMPLNVMLALLAVIASVAGTTVVISHLTGALPQTMLRWIGAP